jgi:hypothetical protein
MQRLFVARFFVTERDVSIADLANLRQKPNESVQAFIHRWRHEANKCRTHLTEEEQVKICKSGIKPEVVLPLSEQISTFRDLATEAHAKERLIALQAERAQLKETASQLLKREKGGTEVYTTEAKPKAGESSQSEGKAKRQSLKKEYPFDERDVLPVSVIGKDSDQATRAQVTGGRRQY